MPKVLDMRWTKLNTDFEAEPNAPMPSVAVAGSDLLLTFFLNPFIRDDVTEGERGQLKFHGCWKYRLGAEDDEEFYTHHGRYSDTGIPWGDFYLLEDSDRTVAFGDHTTVVSPELGNDEDLRHYLFFFRDDLFECLATGFEFKRMSPEPVWRFDQPRNRAVFTLRSIAFEGAPILHVTHDRDDHGWQFLGSDDADPDQACVLALSDIVRTDPSVLELADLEPGWHAWRRCRSDTWVREPNPHDG